MRFPGKSRALRRSAVLAVVLVVALFAGLAPVAAIAAGSAKRGASLYRVHCATCHGSGATGNGPMAKALPLPPADLTVLALGNHGRFPAERVVKQIDGRDPNVSHGSPMPVYGPFFDGPAVAVAGPNGQPIMTTRPIADILSYLETLQRR